MADSRQLQLGLHASRDAPVLENATGSPTSVLPTGRKALGAFYTPPEMAAKLAEWAIRSPNDCVLDPGFGGLAFLQAAASRLAVLGHTPASAGARLYGIDLDPAAREAAAGNRLLALRDENFVFKDFFAVAPGDLPAVEVLLGNPPYIRYHGFNGSAQRAREIARAKGVRLTKLASSWAPFVVHGTSFVAPGGRMAQVLPAELLHAQYASEILEFLCRSFGHVAIAVFEERVFPGALQEVVLLFADERGASGCGDVQLLSCSRLADLDVRAIRRDEEAIGRPPLKNGKLLARLLSDSAQELLAHLSQRREVCRLGDLASVDIGIVTGANDFFVLSRERSEGIAPELLRPGVSKASHVAGARLTAADHRAMLDAGRPGLLFLADRSASSGAMRTAADHIRKGEATGIDRRYKCRIRDPWWSLAIPKGNAPDLLLTYCSSQHPRLAVNEAGLLQTNTLHGVRTTLKGLSPSVLAVGFYNSLTILSAEIVGRSYGGGVLKLEPSEAEDVLVPTLSSELAEILPEVDSFVRRRELDHALDLVDQVVLSRGLGLSGEQISLLRAAADALRSRRLARQRPARD